MACELVGMRHTRDHGVVRLLNVRSDLLHVVVSEHASYHHGEASLHSTIIGMAQDFVGSNNVPLLKAGGQFGTRLQGGKDAASPRYIYTRLNNPIARLLFPVADDPVLIQQEDDGQIIEPLFFVPVIPFVLVNGARGIGTGYSTSIPQFNPLEITEHFIESLKVSGRRLPPRCTIHTIIARSTEWLLP